MSEYKIVNDFDTFDTVDTVDDYSGIIDIKDELSRNAVSQDTTYSSSKDIIPTPEAIDTVYDIIDDFSIVYEPTSDIPVQIVGNSDINYEKEAENISFENKEVDVKDVEDVEDVEDDADDVDNAEEAVIRLVSMQLEISLRDLYKRVKFD